MLSNYAELITPWARSVAAFMVADVERRDSRMWIEHGKEMGKALRVELQQAPTGMLYSALMAEQVVLIKSLPLEAAERVHKLTTAGLSDSRRASDVAKEILATGNVSVARARLIARTEVSRTAASFTQARAMFAGSEGYIWRSSGDGDVRPTHQAVNGKYFRWDSPPKTDKNLAPYHAGCGPNCFTGDTRVDLSNGALTLWRVFYEGELIDFVAGGRLFSVTPNHPILTPNGWVAAGLIKHGDYLLAMGEENVKIIEDDENDVMPSFDELFVALGTEANTFMPSGELDFHGDVFNGQVEQVALKWLLSCDRESVIFKELSQFILTTSDSGIAGGDISHVLESDLACLRNLLNSLFRRLASHCKDIGLTCLADGDPDSYQQFIDGERSCAILLGKSASAEASEVLSFYLNFRKIAASVVSRSGATRGFESYLTEVGPQSFRMTADDLGRLPEKAPPLYEGLCVTQKTVRKFAGHVFTLESNTGWFGITAAGIISKNCRCFSEPVLPDL